MPPTFFDAKTLAWRLDVSYQTLLTWTRRGKIPHFKDGRGRITYNLDSVLAALCAASAVATDMEGATE
ncbi:MAG: hypothetical protein P4L84_33020 [Isosphaeraceae bacterium]|nr:hypothetical protein [Isosphaeraceae bacterium]